MSGYQPGLSIKEIKETYQLKTVYKLASNENPLGPPKGLVEHLNKALQSIHRYPPPHNEASKAIAKYYQVPTDQVAIGNGSSELIDKIMQVYSSSDHFVLMLENSFPLYPAIAKMHNKKSVFVPSPHSLQINVSDILNCLKKHQNISLIFISNPNNPIGTCLNHLEVESLLQVIKNTKTLLVLDEAYYEYHRMTNYPNTHKLLQKYPHNLIILRSLSKVMGLAGLRAGVLISHPQITMRIKQALYPFHVNALALEAIKYCSYDPAFKHYIQQSQKLVWEGLDYFYQELDKLGFSFFPSQANFVLFSPKKIITAQELFTKLLKKGIILRTQSGTLTNHLRMSVGLKEENHKTIQTINTILQTIKK